MSRQVKGTLEIPAEVVRYHREVVDRALTVLKHQWGLKAVELQVRPSEPGAPDTPTAPGRHVLRVAGYSFPLHLEYM